jgi:hypothetical protein
MNNRLRVRLQPIAIMRMSGIAHGGYHGEGSGVLESAGVTVIVAVTTVDACGLGVCVNASSASNNDDDGVAVSSSD